LSSTSIKLANKDDAAMIAVLSRRTFQDAFASFNTEANMKLFMHNEFSAERLVAQVSEPGNIFLLAYHDQEIAGYARLLLDGEIPEHGGVEGIEIARIYAEQNFIGKGIGSALMQRSMDTGREKNKKMIWLGVWEHNIAAIRFYEKWGFEKFGEHIFMLGRDVQTDWLMKKNL
jgi:diamine N-acetyltransferase